MINSGFELIFTDVQMYGPYPHLKLLMSVILWYMELVYLFVKVSRPGDSKGTVSVFKSSFHLLKLV